MSYRTPREERQYQQALRDHKEELMRSEIQMIETDLIGELGYDTWERIKRYFKLIKTKPEEYQP